MTTQEIHDKIQNAAIIPTQETICKILNILESMNGNTIGLEREVTKLKGQTAPAKVATVTGWNIWSVENGTWWMPNGCGYTCERTDAGVYTYEEALLIVEESNKATRNLPCDAMIPVV